MESADNNTQPLSSLVNGYEVTLLEAGQMKSAENPVTDEKMAISFKTLEFFANSYVYELPCRNEKAEELLANIRKLEERCMDFESLISEKEAQISLRIEAEEKLKQKISALQLELRSEKDEVKKSQGTIEKLKNDKKCMEESNEKKISDLKIELDSCVEESKNLRVYKTGYDKLKDTPQGNTKSECQYELKTQDAKLETQDAKPETQDAKPETQDAKPETQDAKPETQDAKPETQDAKLETQDAKPETQDAKPETQDAKPETQDAKPETQDAKPETQDAKPETQDAKPLY
eukprot:gene12257-2894_t